MRCSRNALCEQVTMSKYGSHFVHGTYFRKISIILYWSYFPVDRLIHVRIDKFGRSTLTVFSQGSPILKLHFTCTDLAWESSSPDFQFFNHEYFYVSLFLSKL